MTGNEMNKNDNCRNEWIANKLKSIEKGKSILDAGAGQLRWKPYCSHLKYTSQDFCQFKGDLENNNGLNPETWDTSSIDIVSDIIDIPVDNDSFDIILCSEVLEHIPYPEKAVQEFSRILKKGGELIITAPFNSLTHFAPYHYCTGFNKYWYEYVLGENGFKIDEIKPNGNYFSYMIQEVQRTNSIMERYARKSILVKIGGKVFIQGIKRLCDTLDSSDVLCFGYLVHAYKL